MITLLKSFFCSPERLLNVITREEIYDDRAAQDRILIDEDGNASVNTGSDEVRKDFCRYVKLLRNVSSEQRHPDKES